MQDFLTASYLWIKALHIVAVISWMAGLLYLPRLFVYHAAAEKGGVLSETFKVMERRLLRFIMNPAMIVAWLAGGVMLYANPALMQGGWMHAKLTLVVLMTGFHHALGAWRKSFAADGNARPASFFRKINEVPTVLMILIVVFVVVRPF